MELWQANPKLLVLDHSEFGWIRFGLANALGGTQALLAPLWRFRSAPFGQVMFCSAGGTLAVPSPPPQNRKLPAFGKAWAFPRNLSGMKTAVRAASSFPRPPTSMSSSTSSYRCYCGRGRTLVWCLFGLPPAPRSCARRMWQHRRNRQTIIVKRRRLQP